jgi:hypothetical protein
VSVLCVIFVFDWLVLMSNANTTFANPAVAIIALVMSGSLSIAAVGAIALVAIFSQELGDSARAARLLPSGTTVSASAATGVSPDRHEVRSQTI